MNHSKFGTLTKRDFWNTVLMIFLGSFLTSILTSIEAHHLPTIPEIKDALFIGLMSGIAFVKLKVLSNSDEHFLKKD